jgi:hypothetical protein
MYRQVQDVPMEGCLFTRTLRCEISKRIFLQALEQTGKMVITLNGFDDISPLHSEGEHFNKGNNR